MQFSSNAATFLVLHVHQVRGKVTQGDCALVDFGFQFFACFLKLHSARLGFVKKTFAFAFLSLPFRQVMEEIDDADNSAIRWISDRVNVYRDINTASIWSPDDDFFFMHGGPGA